MKQWLECQVNVQHFVYQRYATLIFSVELTKRSQFLTGYSFSIVVARGGFYSEST